MFLHKTLPIHEVRVENPDPVFAEKLLEQYGGATGELSAALTYLTQSYHTDDPAIRDMLQDIGTEELGHLEMIALLIEQHTKRASGGFAGQGLSKHALRHSRSWPASCRFEGHNLGFALCQRRRSRGA
ncbi:protein of unknown function [Methylocella tundrae]|uniref:Catalase n=1 Tax=Methylocella tundrae TaxID=227605 RepID=A0A4U8YUV7_METTU|nr:protein of unknown function [Methylocella tundrae]